MIRLVFCLIVTFMVYSASAATKPEYLLNQLSEAKDFLRVKPSLSSKLLKQDLANIGLLSRNEQLTWHQYLLRASIALNDLKQVESTVRAMLSYPELKQETDKFVSMLSSLGIFLRRTGYPIESIWLFDCGLKQPIKINKQRISLLISKANSLSYLNKNSQAKAVYAQALELAEKNSANVYISAIYNTMGILAIKEGEFTLAKEYLVNGLQLSQRISRRSGQVVAGLQLLRLSILDDDPMLYDKLHYRISRLILAGKSEVRQDYLFWIEKAHKVSKGKKLTAKEQELLSEKLKKIEVTSIGLYNQLVETLAKPLGIESTPIIKEYSAYQGDILNYIQQCKQLE